MFTVVDDLRLTNIPIITEYYDLIYSRSMNNDIYIVYVPCLKLSVSSGPIVIRQSILYIVGKITIEDDACVSIGMWNTGG